MKCLLIILIAAPMLLSCGENNSFSSSGSSKESSTTEERNSEQQSYLPPVQQSGDILDANGFVERCASSPKKIVKTISYPARQNCAWNQNGNLGAINARIQARVEEERVIELPTTGRLCSLDLKSQTTSYHYDDTMFLALQDTIIISSNDNVLGDFQKVGNLYKWDFDKIKGLSRSFDGGSSYCLGGADSQCQVPGHDKSGALNIVLDSKAVFELSQRSASPNRLDFNLVTTGDNDSGDCKHSNLELELTIGYVTY